LIDERLPFVRELSTSYLGVDPVTDPVPCAGGALHDGGIHTDIRGATPIAGCSRRGMCLRKHQRR